MEKNRTLKDICGSFFDDVPFPENSELQTRVAAQVTEDQNHWAYHHISNLINGFSECGSQIEELFLFELIKSYRIVDVTCKELNIQLFGHDVGPLEFRPLNSRFNDPDKPITVTPQFPVKKYKADFLISMQKSDGKTKSVCVECDGHDYHDRTKEQAQRDKARDRAFLSLGLITLRFTGSEIHKNTGKCVDEVLEYLVSKD